MSEAIDETEWEAASQRHDQALALLAAGRLDEAELAAGEALARLAAVFPGGHPDAANAADTLAAILTERGQPLPAIVLWRRALTILNEYSEFEPAALMRLGVLRNLGHALTMAGEYAAAYGHLDKAQKESARLFGESSSAAALSWNLLGIHYKLQGRYAEAAAAYRYTCDFYDKIGQHWPAFLVHNLAGLACAEGDYVRAEELSRSAIVLRRAAGAPAAFQLGTDLAGLGDALSGRGCYAQAGAAYREALALYESTGHGSHPEVAYALHNLADVLTSTGQMEAAVRCYQDSLVRKESAFGPDHPEVAASLNDLAVVQWRLGLAAAAKSSSARAVQIASRLAAEHPVRLACAKIAEQLRRSTVAE